MLCAAIALIPVVPAGAQQIASSRAAAPARPVNSVVLTLDARYDNNVPRTNPNFPDVRGLAREDVTVSPAVLLDVERNLGRQRVGLRSTLGYDFYLRNSQLNSENIVVAPFADLALPLCDLALQGSVSRRQSNFVDLAYLNDPTLTTKNKETREQVGGILTCGGAYGLRPTFSASWSRGANSNPLRQFSNFESTRISPGLSYATPSLGEVRVFAFKQTTDLPNQIDAFGRANGYETRGGGIGFRRNIGTRLTFDGQVSYADVTTDRRAGSRSGLNYGADLTYVASPRLQLVAHAGRDFNSELSSFSTFSVSEDYSLIANYVVTPRLRVNLGGSIQSRDYVFDQPVTLQQISRQNIKTVFGGASLDVGRRTKLRFNTGYQTRNTDIPIFDYDNFYASVGISFSL